MIMLLITISRVEGHKHISGMINGLFTVLIPIMTLSFKTYCHYHFYWNFFIISSKIKLKIIVTMIVTDNRTLPLSH